MAQIRSDETPSIFNFKKGEIKKHPNSYGSTFANTVFLISFTLFHIFCIVSNFLALILTVHLSNLQILHLDFELFVFASFSACYLGASYVLSFPNSFSIGPAAIHAMLNAFQIFLPIVLLNFICKYSNQASQLFFNDFCTD